MAEFVNEDDVTNPEKISVKAAPCTKIAYRACNERAQLQWPIEKRRKKISPAALNILKEMISEFGPILNSDDKNGRYEGIECEVETTGRRRNIATITVGLADEKREVPLRDRRGRALRTEQQIVLLSKVIMVDLTNGEVIWGVLERKFAKAEGQEDFVKETAHYLNNWPMHAESAIRLLQEWYYGESANQHEELGWYGRDLVKKLENMFGAYGIQGDEVRYISGREYPKSVYTIRRETGARREWRLELAEQSDGQTSVTTQITVDADTGRITSKRIVQLKGQEQEEPLTVPAEFVIENIIKTVLERYLSKLQIAQKG